MQASILAGINLRNHARYLQEMRAELMVLHFFSIRHSEVLNILCPNKTTRIIYADNLLSRPKEYEREKEI